MPGADIKAIKHGSVGRTIFGLPFLLGGFAMLLGISTQYAEAGDVGELITGIVVGGVFGAVGLGLMLYRSGLILDRRSKRVVRWSGLLVSVWRKEQVFDSTSYLRITRERRGSGKNARTVYPVVLLAAEDLELQALQHYQSSRRMAQTIAEFLQLDLHDESSGTAQVRKPDQLNDSLRERYRREGLSAPMPSLPPGSKVRLRRDQSEPIIDVPATGLHPVHFVPLMLLLPFYMVGAPMAMGFRGAPSDLFEVMFFALFFGLPTLFALGFVVTRAACRETIRVTDEGLEITSGAIFRRTSKILGEEIEEIVAPPDRLQTIRDAMEQGAAQDRRTQPGIETAQKLMNFMAPLVQGGQVQLRGDRKTIGLGRGMPADETRWLHQALVHFLVNQARVTSLPSADRMAGGPIGEPLQRSGGHGWLWLTAVILIAASASYELGWLADWDSRFDSFGREAARADAGGRSEGPADIDAYSLQPDEGSGHIDLSARQLRVVAQDSDFQVSADLVTLIATEKQPVTQFRKLGLEIWRDVDGGWERLAAAESGTLESELAAGERYVYPEPQRFRFSGLAKTCRESQCFARLRLNVWAPPDAPGWSVTTMRALDSQY